MATSQLAQALALKKQNPNLTVRDAVAQTKATAQTAPTPTGGATLPITPQVTQPTTPVTPQPTTPPPATPTSTEAPAVVAPTKIETPPTPTTTPPVDKTAEIQAQNQAQMELNKQQAQLKEQERQKIAEETKIANTPTDTKSILTAMASGVSVPVQKTPEWRKANFQYNQFKKFNTMTPSQLTTAMKNGDIDTSTSELLVNNPNYQQAKAEYDKIRKTKSINNAITAVYNGTTGTPTTTDYNQTASDSITSKLGIDETNADAYARIVSNDHDVLRLTTDVSNYGRQLSELNTMRNDAIKDLKAQKGDMNPSAFAYYATVRTKDLSDQIDGLSELYKLAQADFATQFKIAESEYNATKEDIALQSQLAQEERANQRQIDQEQRAITNSLALSEAQFDQKLAQTQQMAKDPTTAISGILSQFAELGITADKSLQQHLADFQSSGLDIGAYTTKMIKDFKNKPLYKAKMESTMAGLQPKATENYELKELGGKTYKFNQATGQYEVISPIEAGSGGDLRYLADQFPGQAWAKNNNPAGITWNANFDKGTGTAKLLADAGINYSKGTARPASEGGNYVTFDTIEDGLKAQQIIMSQTYGNSTVGQMLASWVGTGEGANYAKQVAGNAGIPLDVKVSSLTQEQLTALQSAKIQKESPGLYKLLTHGTGTGTQGTQYNDQQIADLSYLTELQEKNPTQAAKDMKELGYTARDLANYKSGNIPLTEKQKNSSNDILTAINDIVTNTDWNDAVGRFDYTRVIGTQDAVDAEVAINNLIAKLTLPNLGVLKGPMSDKDIQFIKEASSKLSTQQSNKSFERNLIEAYNLAARRAGKPEITKLSDITSTQSGNTVGGELDYSKYESN